MPLKTRNDVTRRLPISHSLTFFKFICSKLFRNNIFLAWNGHWWEVILTSQITVTVFLGICSCSTCRAAYVDRVTRLVLVWMRCVVEKLMNEGIWPGNSFGKFLENMSPESKSWYSHSKCQNSATDVCIVYELQKTQIGRPLWSYLPTNFNLENSIPCPERRCFGVLNPQWKSGSVVTPKKTPLCMKTRRWTWRSAKSVEPFSRFSIPRNE